MSITDKNVFLNPEIIEPKACSATVKELTPAQLNNRILYYQDPIYYLKAIKTRKEIENIKKAHISDGVSLTKKHEGSDIIFGNKINVSNAGMYNIINSETRIAHTMEIVIEGKGFQVFTFTFG